MTLAQQRGRAKTAQFLPMPAPLPKSVGYSVLRAGEAATAEVCILMPHLTVLESVSFDPIAKQLEASGPGARLALAEIPSDVAAMLSKEPQRVLLVSVDALSRARSSARVSDLLASKA